MVLLAAFALTALLALSALALVVAGSKGAGFADFFDRPLCWLLGHPSPGSVMRYTGEVKTTEGIVMPSEVWLCSRCGHLVTLAGPYRKEQA